MRYTRFLTARFCGGMILVPAAHGAVGNRRCQFSVWSCTACGRAWVSRVRRASIDLDVTL